MFAGGNRGAGGVTREFYNVWKFVICNTHKMGKTEMGKTEMG